MNPDIEKLKAACHSDSEETRASATDQLLKIAQRIHDPRSAEATAVLIEIDPPELYPLATPADAPSTIPGNPLAQELLKSAGVPKLKSVPFRAIFDFCASRGWDDAAFELWDAWKESTLPPDIGLIDTHDPEVPIENSEANKQFVFQHCKDTSMTGPATVAFMKRIEVGSDFWYLMVAKKVESVEQGPESARNQYFLPQLEDLLKRIVAHASVMKCPLLEWPAQELAESVLEKYRADVFPKTKLEQGEINEYRTN